MDFIRIEPSGDYHGYVYIKMGKDPWTNNLIIWLSGEGIVRHIVGPEVGMKLDDYDCVRFIKGEPPDNKVGITTGDKIVGGELVSEYIIGQWRYMAIRSSYDHSIDIAIMHKDSFGVGSFVLQIRPEGIYRYGYVSKLLGLPVDSNERLQINRKIR